MIFFLFTLVSYLRIQYTDTINVPFCKLQQLLKLTATNFNARMTSAYKILPHPDKYPWCVLNNWLHGPYRGCSNEQFQVGNIYIYIYIITQNQLSYDRHRSRPCGLKHRKHFYSITIFNASITSAYKILPPPDKYPWCVLNN